MKNLFCFILLAILTFPITAQISIKEILGSAKREKSMLRHQQQMDFIGKKSYEMPWLDGIEFRTETNDFVLREQEFTARASNNSRAERKAESSFQKTMKKIYSTDEQILLTDFLEERYRLIVETYFLQTHLSLKKASGKVHKDQLKVLQKSVNLSGFKINDLIKADNSRKENEREILELEEALTYNQQVISDWTKSKKGFEIKGDFIPIDKVMEKARKLKLNAHSHVKLMRWALNIERSDRELDIIEAQNRKWVDFYQVKYGSSNPTEFRSDFTIGIGLRIPLKKSIRIKTSEIKIEKLIDENNKAHIKEELQEEMKFILSKMETKYRLYQLLNSQIQNSQANTIYQKYKNIEGTSPLALLQLKESDLKTQYELFEVEQNIYQLYIDLIVASGHIAKVPFVNFLSEKFSRF